jgi:hypothetical protein
MAGRLTRFLNLEQPRRPGDAPPHEVATKERFTGVGEPSGIALSHDVGEQPFLRCPRCEADNTRYAERCFNCQADLRGEEVRAWNEQLWARRQEEVAREVVTARESEEELRRQNRMLGEALAREVGQRERARLSWTTGAGGDFTPVGIRLLWLLPTTRARVWAGAAAVAAFFASGTVAVTARGHPLAQVAGAAVALLLLVLFTPNARYRRWW